MKISVSAEIENVHDAIMFDSLIDLWKSKWKADEAEAEVENDDAEDEQDDCDDDTDCVCKCADEEAHRKALDKLAECLRKSGVADVSFTFCGDVDRRKNRS